MRDTIRVIVFAAFVGTSFGQRNPSFYSVGGFGSVVNPGTGHPPTLPFGPATGTAPANPTWFGANITGHPFGFGDHRFQRRDQGGTVIVPYPVYNGGYGYGSGYDAPPPPEQQQSTGIMQYPTMPASPYPDFQDQRDSHTLPTRQAAHDDQPTLYLIAFKDHTVVEALGYWIEGSILHYVNMEYSVNQASMDLIDRSLSQRLNDERGIAFRLLE
jgi:hypothetical protein